jgi:hypothetical protein
MGMSDKDVAVGTIFAQPWWLDAVAPGAWDEIVVEKDGKVLARLPYVIQKRYGFTLLRMPPLTQTLGPWLAPHEAKYVKQLSRQHELMTTLIEKLPAFDYFVQNFHHSIVNWLPFRWRGFEQTTQYTYVIEDLSNLDAVWRETRENIKTDIRKAQKHLVVHFDLNLRTFLDLNEMIFQRQGLSLPYSREVVKRLDRACQVHNCRRIYFAADAQDRVHAAVYIVWDEHSAYYLMGGANPELRNSGATSLLLWEAIQFAATVTQTFDFEGSIIQPIERFFRAFGARQKPYMQISKINSVPLKIGLDVWSWWKLWREK